MPSMIERLKSEVKARVERGRGELLALSRRIHDNPEPGFQEEKAAAWLSDYLKKNGFSVESGVGSLPTSFRATSGKAGPVIALLAEYDALPGLGHACGHNIIAAASVGAAVAGRFALAELGGTIQVLGTPGEESHGGKIPMIEAGLFNQVDVAMMMHPGVRNLVHSQALAAISLEVEFFGKAAHAAAHSEEGINALEAMVLSFGAINSLRQHIQEKSRIHGIITHGGDAPNVVPAYTSARFLVRASTLAYLDELKERVLNCFVGSAVATGARMEHRWGERTYAPLNSNLTLARLLSYNLAALGRKVEPLEEREWGLGSTDMGNVSQVVPAIHPYIAMASAGIAPHSVEFAIAAISEEGDKAVVDAAKSLAMTTVDLLALPEALAEIKKEFAAHRAYRN